MKIDLTFFGVAIKPKIEITEFVDFVSAGKSEVALGVSTISTEDKDYLKERGLLAIPIIIEN
jgi:hypothetical protein